MITNHTTVFCLKASGLDRRPEALITARSCNISRMSGDDLLTQRQVERGSSTIEQKPPV